MKIAERRHKTNRIIITTVTIFKTERALALGEPIIEKTVLSNNERTWERDTPEIGAVLGLRTEYLNKKTSFSVFMEKMEEYILRKLNNGSDVLPLVRDQKDPHLAFETKHLPKDLSAEDKKSEVKVEIHKQRIKL